MPLTPKINFGLKNKVLYESHGENFRNTTCSVFTMSKIIPCFYRNVKFKEFTKKNAMHTEKYNTFKLLPE